MEGLRFCCQALARLQALASKLLNAYPNRRSTVMKT